MKKKYIYMLDIINLILSVALCRWFFMNYIYFYAISIFGFPESGMDFWRPFSAIMILSFTVFTIARVIYTKKINPIFVKTVYVFYFIILLYALLFKNINFGVREINLNLFSFLYDTVTIDAKVPLLNVLIFVPLGALFQFSYKNLGLFTLCIIIIEATQYFFYLGFFDIGDIITNILGIVIGHLIHDSFLGKKIRTLIK